MPKLMKQGGVKTISGRFAHVSCVVDLDVRNAIERIAKERSISMSALCRELLSEAVKATKLEGTAAEAAAAPPERISHE